LRTGGCLPGRQQKSYTTSRSGRYVYAAPVKKGEKNFDIAVDATLRASVLRRAQTGHIEGNPVSISPSDFRKKVRLRPENNLVIFVVDASESMGEGTFSRMAAAKGAVLAMLSRAYQKRDRVGLVSFRDEQADVLLYPTNSILLAKERLRRLPIGGATPFADGLMTAWSLVKTERTKNQGIKPLLVVISDGEANVSLQRRVNVMDELLSIAGKIQEDNIPSIVIDTQRLAKRTDDMRRIALSLGGNYYHVDRMKAQNILAAICNTN